MDAALKDRANTARLVTRRISQLLNATSKKRSQLDEINRRINGLKDSMLELRKRHNKCIDLVVPSDEEVVLTEKLRKEEIWFHKYDLQSNWAIREAHNYIIGITPPTQIIGLLTGKENLTNDLGLKSIT